MTDPSVTSPDPLPDWSLRRPRPWWRSAYDLVGAPLRMALLPDRASERIGLTSLRSERFAMVLPELRGRVLDVGCGDNALLRLYRQRSDAPGAAASAGVDVVDWGGGATLVESADRLPFDGESFDTVCFVACLNHIPERQGAMAEAVRLLRPGGRVVATMIGRFIGEVGHRIWWYSEDKHRETDVEESGGLDDREMMALFEQAGLTRVDRRTFLYGLNRLYVAHKA